MSWSLRFAEPIVLADGVKLATLRQAVSHLVKTVPPAEHGEPIEFAGIATLKAINRHAQRVFNPDRKETKWGRRKWRATDNGQVLWLRSRRHHHGRHRLFGNCSVWGALIDTRDLCMILAHLHGAQIEVGEGPTPPQREEPVH